MSLLHSLHVELKNTQEIGPRGKREWDFGMSVRCAHSPMAPVVEFVWQGLGAPFLTAANGSHEDQRITERTTMIIGFQPPAVCRVGNQQPRIIALTTSASCSGSIGWEILLIKFFMQNLRSHRKPRGSHALTRLLENRGRAEQMGRNVPAQASSSGQKPAAEDGTQQEWPGR